MTWARVLLFGVMAWTAIGVAGSLLSGLRRGDWTKARRGFRSIALVWTVYLAALLAISRQTPERAIPQGTPECFAHACFTVADTQWLTSFAGRGQPGGRLLRVTIRVSRRTPDDGQPDTLVRVYLRDSGGRRWFALPGVGGIPLTAPLPAGTGFLSQPVFGLPADVHGLDLILTHGPWQPGRLVLGDPDSLFHRPHVVHLADRTPAPASAP